MIFDNMQGAIFNAIAERNHPAHPHALFLGRGDLVADPLARDLPLELGEGEQESSVSVAACWSSIRSRMTE